MLGWGWCWPCIGKKNTRAFCWKSLFLWTKNVYWLTIIDLWNPFRWSFAKSEPRRRIIYSLFPHLTSFTFIWCNLFYRLSLFKSIFQDLYWIKLIDAFPMSLFAIFQKENSTFKQFSIALNVNKSFWLNIYQKVDKTSHFSQVKLLQNSKIFINRRNLITINKTSVFI